jgi:hypothetical protein
MGASSKRERKIARSYRRDRYRAPMERTLARLRRLLAENGLRFGVSGEALERALETKLGPRRFAAYLARSDAYARGLLPARAFYAVVRDAEEAALFQSHQADLVATLGARLFDVAIDPLRAGARVVELGAWHGALADAYAALRPDLRVAAIEREPRLVSAGRARFRRRNLTLVRGTYRTPPKEARAASAVVSCLGVDFAFGEAEHPLSGFGVRGSPIHVATRREAAPLFFAARRVLREGATCAVALRAHNRGRAIAIVDAAAAHGFDFDFERSDVVRLIGGEILFGVFRRVRGDTAALEDEAELLRFLKARRGPPAAKGGRTFGEDAATAFEALVDKRPSEEAYVRRDDGVRARVEAGVAADGPYAFLQCEDGAHELTVASRGPTSIESVRPRSRRKKSEGP